MLAVILARTKLERTGGFNRVHSFDCGSAFENIALQGTAMGLVVHGMMGFDFDKARAALAVPDDYEIVAMFAVGRPGDAALLPDNLRAREIPSGRKPVNELICEGSFSLRK
jgi:nitroreductase